MNLVELKPGEAMYVAEDGLHAWLDGQIIELMANSYVSLSAVLSWWLTPHAYEGMTS